MELIQQKADMLQNRKIVKILLDVAKTLGRQSIAFRGEASDQNANFYQIVHLIARHCPDLKQWLNNARLRPYHVTYMSAQSQSKFIQLIGNQVQQKVIKEIQHAGMFAVMADTTPDASHKDRLALACRNVDHEEQPRERLLSLTEAKDKTGGGTANEIIESITANRLKTSAVWFQSYDYIASMSGQFNGAQKKLQEKLERNVPYMLCLAHRTHTMVEHSCNASPIIKEFFNVLEAVYVFFTSSTKRVSALKEFIASEEVDDPLCLRNLSRTRWTARAESIKSVWKSFEAIVDCLDSLRRNASDGNTKTDAAALLMKLLNFDTIFSIMSMKNLMNKTKRMTEALQTESLNVIDTISLMESTTDILQAIKGDKDGMDAEIEAAIAFAKRLNFDAVADFERHHRHRQPPQRIDSNPQTAVSLNMKSFYWKEFTQVLDTQISMLRDVLLNCKEIVTPLMELLHPAKEVSS